MLSCEQPMTIVGRVTTNSASLQRNKDVCIHRKGGPLHDGNNNWRDDNASPRRRRDAMTSLASSEVRYVATANGRTIRLLSIFP